VRGRLFSWNDDLKAPPVVVIDASMAQAFWPDEDPLGKPLYVHTRVHEVVGVVEDIRHFGPAGVTRPTVYIPTPQEGWSGAARGLALVVRGGPRPESLVPAIRRAVWDVNPSIAFGPVKTLEQLKDENLAAPRFRSILLGAFGLTAVLLAVLGITGVMAYSVARRVREMGIRMAVGAPPAEVRELVLREGIALTAIGLAAGLLASAVLGRFVDALLFEVSARDPLVFGAVAVVAAASGILASLVPAWKASRVDPTVALATE
jgi:putative ABC transport system permease protein